MRIAERVTNSLLADGIISDEETEIIQFGLESIWDNAIGMLLTVSVGIFYGKILSAILVWAMLFFLRKNAGGYHAQTKVRCLILSVAILAAVFGIYELHMNTDSFVNIITVISGGVIWCMAPIGNPAKMLDEVERRVYKKRTRFILVTEGLIFICAGIFGLDLLCQSVSMTFFIVSTSFIMEKEKRCINT